MSDNIDEPTYEELARQVEELKKAAEIKQRKKRKKKLPWSWKNFSSLVQKEIDSVLIHTGQT